MEISQVDAVPVKEFTFHKRVIGKYLISDDNNNIIFKMIPYSNNTKYILLEDANSNIKALLRKEFWSCHGRWSAYRANDPNKMYCHSDLMFSIKKESMIRSKSDLLVSGGNDELIKIKGSWSTRNFSIYSGDRLMAQIKTMEFVKDKFTITIYPNVDYISVMSLIVIIEAISMNTFDKNHHHHHQADVEEVAEGVSLPSDDYDITFFQDDETS